MSNYIFVPAETVKDKFIYFLKLLYYIYYKYDVIKCIGNYHNIQIF